MPLTIFAVLYGAALIYVFFPLIAVNQILPGGDTMGHFLALTQFLSGLQNGHFFQYTASWFGGMPLFILYAPLSFLIMAGAVFAFGKFLSVFIIFRWFIFLSFAVFPLPFYFFLKEFVGEKAARWGLWLSLLVVFYPPIQNFAGLGASGAVVNGLFDEMFAVSLLLIYLTIIKRLVDKRSLKLVVWGGVVLGLLFLAHTLTSIMAGWLTLLIAIFYCKHWFKEKYFWSLFGVIGLGFLLSAFWLVPFIHALPFSSAERVDVTPFTGSPLNLFFNFDLAKIIVGHLWAFEYASFFTGILFIFGLVHLIRDKKYLLPYVFIVTFFVTGLDWTQEILPTLTIHWYRLLALDLIFYFAIAAVGAVFVFECLTKHRRWLGYAFAGLIFLALVHLVGTYRLTGNVPDAQVPSYLASGFGGMDYYWTVDQFGNFGPANKVISLFGDPNKLPEPPRRVMPDMNPAFLNHTLGSIHFFNTTLPLVDHVPSLFGLYAESAWQLPFIFPTTNPITGDNMLWGRVRDLAFNQYFNGQSLADMFDRLKLFGVNYLVTASNLFDQNAQAASGTSLIANFDPFKVYLLKGSNQLAYPAGHTPGLFVRASGLDFREFSLGWFSVPELLQYPVADWTQGTGGLTPEAAKNFSFIAVGMDGQPSADFVKQVTSLGKPVVFLNEASSSLGLANGRNVQEIDDFISVARPTYTSDNLVQPNTDALSALSKFIHDFATPNPDKTATTTVYDIGNERAGFSGQGPVIVSLGYFPYWQCAAGCSNVYPVTPGQMLVFANGPTVLEYKPGTDATVGFWLSIIGVIGAGGLIYWDIRKKRSQKV